jgi:hypothetical protein
MGILQGLVVSAQRVDGEIIIYAALPERGKALVLFLSGETTGARSKRLAAPQPFGKIIAKCGICFSGG